MKIFSLVLNHKKSVSLTFLFIILTAVFLKDFTLLQKYRSSISPENSQYKILGRLAKSAQDGPFSRSLFLGFCYDIDKIPAEKKTDSGPGNNISQANHYEQASCPYFDPYYSHPGYSGLLFYALSRVFPSQLGFRIFAASTLALSVCLLLLWFAEVSSLMAAGLGCLSFLFFRWFIEFGDNFGLIIGTMYLPMVFGLLAYHFKKENLAPFLIFASLLFSLLLSGSEYVFSTIVMCILPICYYAKYESWDKTKTYNQFKVFSIAIFAAIGLATLSIVLQLVNEKGFQGTYEYFGYTINKRTIFGNHELQPYYQKPKSMSLSEVLLIYLRFPALAMFGVGIRIYQFIIGLACLVSWIKLDHSFREKKRTQAIAWLTTCSLAAPLAWLTLCKPHVIAHTFMDPMVWHMPFLLFMALFGCHVFTEKSKQLFGFSTQ